MSEKCEGKYIIDIFPYQIKQLLLDNRILVNGESFLCNWIEGGLVANIGERAVITFSNFDAVLEAVDWFYGNLTIDETNLKRIWRRYVYNRLPDNKKQEYLKEFHNFVDEDTFGNEN